jgi:hypothetical protein
MASPLAVLGLTLAASGQTTTSSQTPTPEDVARLSSEARRYGCPKPNIEAFSTCRQVTYKKLPRGASTLLRNMKCRVGPNYDCGSAVDLNARWPTEYLVCCQDAPHGPCAAVVVGKVDSVWKDLTAKDGVLAYTPPCGLFFVLDSRHNGFSDVCLPAQCSMVSPSPGKPCVPTIWHFLNGRYRSVAHTPPE